ncbi:MAG: hypothetical protein A3C56_13260 [Ignavibacteria bacterium RIFCSPHIGHO2_02_FULL_56_12]|nr:MAG: hypothetical protein A3C56_13260 [Ignavibacteria bacterium RIFCSPHIGHO2_02_FULL_56_12]
MFSILLLVELLKGIPSRVAYGLRAGTVEVIPILPAYGAQSTAFIAAQEFPRYRQKDKLAYVIVQVDQLRVGRNFLDLLAFFIAITVGQRPFGNVKHAVCPVDDVTELVKTPVAHKASVCRERSVEIELSALPGKVDVDGDRTLEFRPEADVRCSRGERIVMLALGQTGYADAKSAHRSVVRSPKGHP